jgi:cation/acetate symporter
MARYNLTTTIQHGPVGQAESNIVYEQRPEWFQRWEQTGLLSFTDKNGDGRVQYYNEANPAMAARAAEFGWKGSELKVDNDIMVLANPEIAGLPDWVIALVAAGAVAAALSTAAGLLLVISSAISHDVFKGALMPDMSEKSELMVGRISAAVAIGIAGYLGYNPPGFVAQVVAFAFGLAAASLFPAILMGIFSKSTTREGAIAGMLTGLVFTFGYILYFKGIFITPLAANVPANWLFGISPEGIGTVGAALNFAVTYAVSKVTAAPPKEVQELVEHIRVPAGAGRAHAH